jgi:hypothetical protein
MSLSHSSFKSMMLCLALSAAYGQTVAAQEGARTPAYHAVISREQVPVRSGASDNYYAFGALEQGAVVGVIEEKFGWARILTDGPDFASFYGYVKEEEVKLAAGGRSGVTLGRVQVFAPNVERDGDPDASWKWITRIDAEKPIIVLDSVAGENGGYYKIALPETGEGWVSLNFLRKATADEVTSWRARAQAAPDRLQRPAGDGAREGDPVPPAQIIDEPMGPPRPQQSPPAITDEAEPVEEEAALPVQAEEADLAPEEESGTHAAEATGPAADEVEPQNTPQMQARKTFEALEWAYEALKKEPIRTAEVDPLRQRYLELLDEAMLDERDTVIARGRVQLLDARLKLQERVLELDRVKAQTDLNSTQQERARIALEFAENYAAVGEVAVSTIYNGDRLPELLRLMDPATGRTIAYLQPDDEFKFAEKVGMLVGIVGEKYYDGGLRLHVIQPKRVDLLQTVKQNDVAAVVPDGE